MTNISDAAAARREAARTSGGEFGSQSRSVPDGLSDTFLAPIDTSPASATDFRSVKDIVPGSGSPAQRVRNRTAADLYLSIEGEDTVAAKMRAVANTGRETTVLVAHPNGNIYTVHGSAYTHEDGSVSFETMAGSQLAPNAMILDVERGDAVQAFNTTFKRRMAQFTPELADVDSTLGDVPEFDQDSDPRDEIAAVYMVEVNVGDAESTPGCLLFVTDKQTNEDNPDHTIVNGWLHVPGGSGLTSESGSMYLRELQARGGQVVDYRPGSLTFADAMDMPSDDEAYRKVLGR